MLDYETTVAGIEFKLRKLADLVGELRNEVAEERARRDELEEEVKNKDITINKLKEENRLIRLGNRLTEKDESADLKIKINQMIRTVDRSIEMVKAMSERSSEQVE